MTTPHFPHTINLLGTLVALNPPSGVPSAAHVLMTTTPGMIGRQDIGMIALALSWPAFADPPWTLAERQALQVATGARDMLEAQLRGSEALRNDLAERSAVERDYRAAIRAVATAQADLAGATIADIPVDPQARATLARRILDSLVAAGVPAATAIGWALEVGHKCYMVAHEGWELWAQMEASGFSMAPVGISSSGASGSLVPTAATLSDGSP